jgi:hypothetical protein
LPRSFEWILLRGVDLHALACAQLVERFARKLAVARETTHRVVHVAACRLIGEFLELELADERSHLPYVLGGARFVVGLLHAEGGAVLVHRADEARRERLDRFFVFLGATDDLVVDIGDVSYVVDAVAARPQPAADHVENDEHARVSEVAIVVDRHAADVHAHFAGSKRDKFLLCPTEGVEDLQD